MVKVLILGVGNAQRDALLYLKERNYITHGISYRREGRGIEYCDHFEVIDIKAKHKVQAYAEKSKIDLVYSVGSDLAMPTVGYVSEQMGLPYYCSEESAILLNNKFLFRKFLKEHDLLKIAFQKGNHWKDFQHWDKFPAMVKPVSSQGQRGIRRIDNKDELKTHILNAQQFSASGEVILEQFINGDEVSANVFLKEGRILYSFISDRKTYEDLDGGLVKAHIFPTRMNKDLQARALQIIEDTVKKLKIRNGPVYFQMMYDSDDVHIIEATPRLDGCHIWRLIRFYAGVDLLKLSFDLLLGETVVRESIQLKSNNMGLHFLSQKPQVEFKSMDFEIPETTKFHEFYYENGQLVRPLNKVFEKVGYYIK